MIDDDIYEDSAPSDEKNPFLDDMPEFPPLEIGGLPPTNGYHSNSNGHVAQLKELEIANSGDIEVDPPIEEPATELYDPPVKRRTIVALCADMVARAKSQYSLDFVTECAKEVQVGDSKLVTSILKDHVVYDHTNKEWYIWNNLHWEADLGCNVAEIASDVAVCMYRKAACEKYAEAISASDKEKAKKLKAEAAAAEKRADAMRKGNSVKAVLEFAAATLNLGITGEEWDTVPNLLGVSNGVIDLTANEPVYPSAHQYIRTVAPIPFVRGAKCPLFDKALLEIFDNDKSKIAYLWRLLGYAISGACSESDFLIWYGKHGRNGKEFILERIKAVLGDKLAGIVEAELLLKSNQLRGKNSSTESLMVLRGRRIAWASETDEGRQLDANTMKHLAGGHSITGRHNFGRQDEWRRTHTLFLLTNNLPKVTSQEFAEWDRIRVLSFPFSFTNDPDSTKPWQRKKDKTLDKRIDAKELPGILNRLIAGYAEWRQIGLATPEAVKKDTALYKADEDVIGHFIKECCNVEPDGAKLKHKTSKYRVELKRLYTAYRIWFGQDNPESKPMGKKKFFGEIRNRGFYDTAIRGVGHFGGLHVK